MNLLPRDFKDINCSTSVYRSVYNLFLRFYVFTISCSIGFQSRCYYLLVDNILLLSIIRKYPTNFFSHKRDINRSVRGVEISKQSYFE